MADPKYADLPGIAYDQVDVYETTDLPESQQFEVYSEDETDSIERLHISATEAFNKFKSKNLVGAGVDFSDRISRKPRTGYNSVFVEWELRGENEKETLLQKYHRLQCEIQELIAEANKLKEMAKDDEQSESAGQVISKVEQINKQLDNLKLEEHFGSDLVTALVDPQGTRLKQLVSQIEQFKDTGAIDDEDKPKDQSSKGEVGELNVLKYQMRYLPEKARFQEVARLSHLEQRLGRLENVIGINDDKLARLAQTIKSQGVMESVQQLSAKASLLDISQLDAVERRLAALVHTMDTIAEKRAATLQDTEREQKISEIYKVVNKTQAASEILPQIVSRMLTLSNVHAQAAQFAKSLTQLEELQSRISDGLDSNKSLLKGVQESFAENLEIIKNNIIALDERVKKLRK
ncbi:dynactin subunit 2 isoform X2 [Cephus cinctus]|uniref:Dynactin subunit 2 isoform X2 n=1 Tax=Cephus cinctus TaxID=211228 RepID=A0AAJ7BZN2_CEPCN|nr:dynactin subunit 2 isoform X2 [Cephus cinctus]